MAAGFLAVFLAAGLLAGLAAFLAGLAAFLAAGLLAALFGAAAKLKIKVNYKSQLINCATSAYHLSDQLARAIKQVMQHEAEVGAPWYHVGM